MFEMVGLQPAMDPVAFVRDEEERKLIIVSFNCMRTVEVKHELKP